MGRFGGVIGKGCMRNQRHPEADSRPQGHARKTLAAVLADALVAHLRQKRRDPENPLDPGRERSVSAPASAESAESEPTDGGER